MTFFFFKYQVDYYRVPLKPSKFTLINKAPKPKESTAKFSLLLKNIHENEVKSKN